MEPDERDEKRYILTLTGCRGPVSDRELYIFPLEDDYACFAAFSCSSLMPKQVPTNLLSAILLRNDKVPFGHWAMAITKRGTCSFSTNWTVPLFGLDRGVFFKAGATLIEEACRLDAGLAEEGLL